MTDAPQHLRTRADGGRAVEYPPAPEPLAVPVYDNHTHLEIADGALPLDVHEHLERAASVGVAGAVQVGTDVATSRWSADVADREPRLLAAVALHPNEAPELEASGALDDALAVIDELAARPRVRAIGETGLDFYRTDEAGRPAQFRAFEAHIDIAKRHDLAMQIHDRDAHGAVVETLRRVGAPERTVFHCFSGDVALARICADNGWFVSVAGTATFKNAVDLREALAIMPKHLLLIETDSPYLTPTPFRGRTNSSYMIPYTLRALAEYLEADLSMLSAQIASNTESVYGHWDDEPVTAPRMHPSD